MRHNFHHFGHATRTQGPMTLDQIKAVAPSVFATHPQDTVSNRYTFIPTVEVLGTLMREGWLPMRAEQNRVKLAENREFTRHMLRFRREGATLQVGDTFAELVLVNAHNAGAAYRLFAGLFRLKCSNGLIVDEATFASIQIRHTGNVLDEVRFGADQVVAQVPAVLERVGVMETIDLTENERGVFAAAAAELKYNAAEQPISPAKLLAPRRYEDRGKTDLWHTYNTVQENILKGGVRYTKPFDPTDPVRRVRRQSTRKVTSITEDVRLNKALWTLAEKMRELKVSA